MEVEEEEEVEEEVQNDEHDEAQNEDVFSEEEENAPISWKPQSTVPMFAIHTDDAKSSATPQPQYS